VRADQAWKWGCSKRGGGSSKIDISGTSRGKHQFAKLENKVPHLIPGLIIPRISSSMKLDAEHLAGVSEQRHEKQNTNDVIVELGARDLGWTFLLVT
jgi:hypothetical protein